MKNNKFSPEIRWTIGIGFIILALIVFGDIYFKPGISDILVELHGLFFDIVIFGIIVGIINHLFTNKMEKLKGEKSKTELISLYKNEIEDFVSWNSEEARYRIIGNIRRLNKLGVSQVKLTHFDFSNLDLSYLNFSQSILHHGNFSKCKFLNTNFQNAQLEKASFSQAQFINTDFSFSFLGGAKFVDCIIHNVKFNQAKLYCFDYKLQYKSEFPPIFLNQLCVVFETFELIPNKFKRAIGSTITLHETEFEMSNEFKEAPLDEARVVASLAYNYNLSNTFIGAQLYDKLKNYEWFNLTNCVIFDNRNLNVPKEVTIDFKSIDIDEVIQRISGYKGICSLEYSSELEST